MVALLVGVGISLIVSLAGTPVLIRSFQARGVGQQIRDDGPEGHFTKAGTPTMGGITIIGAAGAGYVAAHLRTGAVFTAAGGLVLLTILATGGVGLLDDWLKVSRQQSLGLNKRAKIGAQLMVAGSFAFLAVAWARMNTDLSFTRSLGIGMNNAVWVVWAVTIIIGASNAVNLADGLDGLATMPVIIAALTLGQATQRALEPLQPGTVIADPLHRVSGVGQPVDVLVEADAVEGRMLTSWPSVKTDIENAGGDWVDEEVVVDDNIITSRSPKDLDAFCAKIIEELEQLEDVGGSA